MMQHIKICGMNLKHAYVQFMESKAYIRREETSQTYDLSLENLEEKQIKPQSKQNEGKNKDKCRDKN